jgi:hypothetical protein
MNSYALIIAFIQLALLIMKELKGTVKHFLNSQLCIINYYPSSDHYSCFSHLKGLSHEIAMVYWGMDGTSIIRR